MGKLSPRQRKLSEVTSLARQRLNSGCLSHRSLLNLNRNDPPSLCLHVAISLPSYPWWPQWSPREMYRDSQGLWRCHCGRVGLQVWAGCLGSHLQCLCLLFCSSGCRTMGLPARLLHAPRSLLSGQVEVAAWTRSRENVGGAQRDCHGGRARAKPHRIWRRRRSAPVWQLCRSKVSDRQPHVLDFCGTSSSHQD